MVFCFERGKVGFYGGTRVLPGAPGVACSAWAPGRFFVRALCFGRVSKKVSEQRTAAGPLPAIAAGGVLRDSPAKARRMQIQIEATADIVTIEGVECRRWKGTTESGVECEVFVHRIAVKNGDDSSQFDRELLEQVPPGRPARDLAFFLD